VVVVGRAAEAMGVAMEAEATAEAVTEEAVMVVVA